MIQGIDHVLIAVPDLELATEIYQALAFQVLRGGTHPRMGTQNALVPLADGCYLELIAVTDPALAEEQVPFVVAALERENRIARFVLESDYLETDVSAMRARGLHMGDPLDGERERPDGTRVAWRSAFPLDMHMPFVLQDVTPRPVRVPRPTEGIGQTLRMGDINVGVTNVLAATTVYQQLLGIDGEDGWFQLPRGAIILKDVDTQLILNVTLTADNPLELIEQWRAANVEFRENVIEGIGMTLEPLNTMGAPLLVTGSAS